MSLALALNNALSGLRTNQQSISVLSHNIANVNTAGYSRQIVNQSAINIEGTGSGVKIDDITRKIDKYLQRSTQVQSSNYASSDTLDSFYQRIQALLGQPGASNSLDTAMTGYFNSVQQLAESPETNSLKSNAISAGVTLAKQLSDLAANVHDLRFQADTEIGDAVSIVNSSLDKLYKLNGALTQAHSLGQVTAGLLDNRDIELTTLSQYMNISVSYGEAGNVNVVGGDGVPLLEDGVHHELRYSKAQSINNFVQDAPLGPLQVVTLNDQGIEVGNPLQLISGGQSENVTSSLSSGKLAALQQIRDVKFPSVLAQLDMLASRLRDNVNTIHNNGSGFPPATSLTGDRLVRSSDQYDWTGQVRIAVLKADGSPVPSTYSDETYTGLRPLTLDLGRLDSGQGNGKPTLQTIVDEINNHFGSPGNKAKLGNINNIQLASDTNLLPSGATSLFNCDLDLENISSDTAQVFVTGATVLDDTGTNITSMTQTAPSITIQPTGSYTTTLGSADVTIALTTPATGLSVGDKIYLAPPSAAVNGITVGQLSGFFTVTAVSGNQVTFTSGGTATSSGSVNDAGSIQMMPPYDYVAAGFQERTRDHGQMQFDFSGNLASDYYDVTLTVSVIGADGVINTAPITYRVPNNESQIYNKRYDATAVGAPATLVLPGTSQESLRAILVDDKGVELPTANGKYIDGAAYLKLVAGNDGATSYTVAVDEMNSTQLGKPDGSPAEKGTNWGFSHYFGLNDFFDANLATITGDTVKGSAYNLKVQDRLVKDANLMSVGNLTLMTKNASSGNNSIYTYARYSGDNTVAQKLAKMNTQVASFDAAGGLPVTQQSLQSYAGQVVGYVSQRSVEASDNASNAKTLYDGFKSKSEAISGVNLDEELANTITLQNSYSASARIMTIVNKMYEDLLQSL